jgi:hypothetical protein
VRNDTTMQTKLKTKRVWIWLYLLGTPAASWAFCPAGNATLQQQCEAQEQRAQQQAQQQAQQRAQQQAQQRAQQEAQQRAQLQAQQHTPQQPTRPAPTVGVPNHPPGGSSLGGFSPGAADRPHDGTMRPPGSGSTQVGSVQQINAQRASLAGVNRRPVPPGNVLTDARGRATVTTTDGRHYELRPNGTVAAFRGPGRNANFDPDGRIRSVHTPTVDIVRGARGERMTVVRGPDRTMLVSFGPRSGYVQRPLVYRGRPYMQRTYLVGDHVVVRDYAAYRYGGFVYYGYVPAYSFAPAYYTWLATPWGAPVVFTWAWTGAPWYSSGYFVPYPSYPTPAAWITDYYLGAVLSADYAAQADAQQEPPSPNGGAAAVSGDPRAESYASAPAPITPELKTQITAEVQDQVSTAQSQNAAEAGLPSALKPNHIFVVDHPLNVVTDQEQGCTLSSGDVLKLLSPPDAGIPTAQMQVAASRESDCPAMAVVTMTVDDLQEMYNSFRAQLDAAAQALATQSTGGAIPAPPAAQMTAVAAPPSDAADTATLINTAETQGDQTEAAITTTAFTQ